MNLYDFIDRSERALVKQSYKLKNAREKLSKIRNHVTFLIRCRNTSIIPNGLRIRIPNTVIDEKNGRQIENNLNKAVLTRTIKAIRFKKRNQEDIIFNLRQDLSLITETQTFQYIDNWSNEHANRVFKEVKERQKKKFVSLHYQVYKRKELDVSKVIKNLSDHVMSESEREVLKLGLNFEITPNKVPTNKIIAATESIARKMESTLGNKLRF